MPYQSVVVGVLDVVVSHHGLEVVVLGVVVSHRFVVVVSHRFVVVVSHQGLEVVVLCVVVSHRFVDEVSHQGLEVDALDVVVSHRFVVVVSYQVEVAVVHQGVVRGVVWVFSISRWQSGAFTSFGIVSLGTGLP